MPVVKLRLRVQDENPQTLHFLKPRLMQSRTAVVIPFDHRILFVSSFHCAEFPCGLPDEYRAPRGENNVNSARMTALRSTR
jgi:hypothetical protein